MKVRDLPQLAQFLGGWFHQDWMDEGYKSAAEVVRAYARDEMPGTVRESMKEIEALLASRLPPVQMRRLLADDLGCAYDPTADGKTFRAWLREVHEILRRAQAKH